MPNATGQFRIATTQFGHVMFCMSEGGGEGKNRYPFTDKPESFPAYGPEDNREIKLGFWKGVARAYGLDPKFVQIVEA